MVEVDARGTTIEDDDVVVGRGQNGPCMCNVVVDPLSQRKVIASALVKECELQTHE